MSFPAIANPIYTSGGIPFEYLFDDYQEQFLFRASNSFLKARVAWDESGDFTRDVLGYTTGVPGVGASGYLRTLPLEHPMIDDQWCVDCKLLSYPGSGLADVNQDDGLGFGGFSTDWAVYGLTFSRLPYFVASDSEVGGQTIPELFRYCTIANRPRAREFTINSYALQVEGTTTTLPNPAFIIDREQDIVITQYQVPSGLLPYTAIDNCLGRINLNTVTLPITYAGAGSYVTRDFAAQTLLFRGVANEITNYPAPLGDSATLSWYVDLPLVFTYRPVGWRTLPDPTPGGNGAPVSVVRIGIVDAQNKYLYATQDFAALFKPI